MVGRAKGLANCVQYDVTTLTEEAQRAAEDVARCPGKYRKRSRQRRAPGGA